MLDVSGAAPLTAGVRRHQTPEKMDTNEKEEPEPVSTARVVTFVIGVVVFGVLMGMRPEFGSHWTRCLFAGIAGAVLAACTLPMRRR